MQPRPSPARAAALPVDLGQQYRRIFHGPGGGSQGPAARRGRGAIGRRAQPDPAARRDRRRGGCADRRPAAGLARAARRLARSRAPGRHRRRDHTGRGRLARAPVRRPYLAGADPAGDRPRPSVPVHPEQELLADLRPAPSLRWRADSRIADDPGDAAALHPPARRGGALRRDRDRDPPPDRQALPGLQIARRRRLSRDPRQRHRDRGGGRGFGPLLPHRVEAPPPRPA